MQISEERVDFLAGTMRASYGSTSIRVACCLVPADAENPDAWCAARTETKEGYCESCCLSRSEQNENSRANNFINGRSGNVVAVYSVTDGSGGIRFGGPSYVERRLKNIPA